MKTITIPAEHLGLVLAMRRTNDSIRWGAMSAHRITADCRKPRYPGDAPIVVAEVPARPGPLNRGQFQKVVTRIESEEGRVGVMRTFGSPAKQLRRLPTDVIRNQRIREELCP